MTGHLFGLAALLMLALPVSASPVPVKALNLQLQQAIDRQDWDQAVQIVDQMLLVQPQQARQLRAYRQQLQARMVGMLNPIDSTVSIPNLVSTGDSRRRNVTAVNALVSKYEFRDEYFIGDRRWFTPLVDYSLKVDLYNGTPKIAKLVRVYYDILSWNQENNESGSFVVADIQPGREYSFNQPLLNGPVLQDSLNRYEGVRVRINRIDWLDDEGSLMTNDASIKFGYWGKI